MRYPWKEKDVGTKSLFILGSALARTRILIDIINKFDTSTLSLRLPALGLAAGRERVMMN